MSSPVRTDKGSLNELRQSPYDCLNTSLLYVFLPASEDRWIRTHLHAPRECLSSVSHEANAFPARPHNRGRSRPDQRSRSCLSTRRPGPRLLFATQFTRHLDRSGYIRFRRWRFYAEAGLAKRRVQVSIYTSTRHPSSTTRPNWPFTPSPGTRKTSTSRKSVILV